jgi:copper(I)-binding protein
VTKAWVGETVPGQTTSTLQLNLTTVKAVNLISVSSPIAESVEIHSLMMNKGAMKLQVVNSYSLPEHRTTLFGSHGLFLMMTGIKQPLKIGDQVPLSLTVTFADKQTKVISANAEVRKMELSYKHYGPNEVYDHR